MDELPRTRAEAEATGINKYFTGKPCKNGHLSFRYARNSCCSACLTQEAQSSNGLARRKEYSSRPDVKARKRERRSLPENKAKIVEYLQRPEVKARAAELQRSPKYVLKRQEYAKSMPDHVADKRRAYHRTPEARLRANERRKADPNHREKATLREQKPDARLRREAYRKRPEFVAEEKERRRKRTERLSDCYVRHSLHVENLGLKVSDIPQPLVETKRLQLQLQRQLKGMK